MKLKNKKTGDIGTLTLSNDGETFILMNEGMYIHSVKLKDLEEWEDYEEPKEYWCIDWTGGVNHITVLDGIDEYEKDKKQIGNYFETKEEAEKAVEKLKAWKRLKDKGFRFDRWNNASSGLYRPIWFYFEKDTVLEDIKSDLDLLFSGGEDEN